jgi:hypothetical protein
MFAGAVVSVDAAAAGDDTAITITMGTATALNLGDVAFGGTNGVDTTITGSTGNDTITAADAKGATSVMSVTGNGGSDAFRIEDGSGNAAGGVVVANAFTVTDFNVTNDQVLYLRADLTNSAAQLPLSIASGAGNFDTGGFFFINNATMSDFTSKAQLAAAVGAISNFATAGDTAAFAVANVAGTQIAIYDVVEAGADADNVDATNDTITLVAILNITGGTFALTNMSVF